MAATVNNSMFKKFKQLSLRQEADGATKVEVREDEEQGVKLQEIVDLLVAAGYFRARIKGLSAFDKVVGGLTWCIESCNIDIDVDLLFQENSTIKQKIALTEKIVAVLPKLKCPHAIEPHQIQGLDFIHIFPVIQWLVKRSLECRQESSQFVRAYAINQFHKANAATTTTSDAAAADEEEKGSPKAMTQFLANVSRVRDFYAPRRYYRRKTATNTMSDDVNQRVQMTLLEYGMRNNRSITSASSASKGDGVDTDAENGVTIGAEHQIDDVLLKGMAEVSDDHILYEEMRPEDLAKLIKRYEAMQIEFESKGPIKEVNRLIALEQQFQLISEHCDKVQAQKDEIVRSIDECSDALQVIRGKRDEIEKSIKELDVSFNNKQENVKEVEELIILNDNLRSQELQFREHCKQELANLHTLIEETKKAKTPVMHDGENRLEYELECDRHKRFRLQLAKKIRLIAALQRQIDDVPSRAELAQYQRRFLELYNQVASKHKETKQYYTLYNTLGDTKQYMKRELSLLNSILESYPDAMKSSPGKDEFLKQLETIVESVKQSKCKVEKRLEEEKTKRDQLTHKLQSLIDLQRKYVAAVKLLSVECGKHESRTQFKSSS